MVQIESMIKPGYDACCGCIDVQVLSNKKKDCGECNELKHAYLLGFVREKGKTYGVISYDSGSLDAVEIWRIHVVMK